MKKIKIFLVILFFLTNNPSFLLSGPKDLLRRLKGDITSLKDKNEVNRKAILAKFDSFRQEIMTIRPDLKLEFPIKVDKAKKMRSHNVIPGKKTQKKVYAFVSRDYQLKTEAKQGLSIGGRVAAVSTREKVEVVIMYSRAMPDQKDKTSRWCLVKTKNGKQGFIPNTYLQKSNEEKPDKRNRREKKYVTSFEGLKMRTKPSLYGNVITVLPYESEVLVKGYSRKKEKIEGRYNYWARLEFEGRNGWVFNGYLRSIKNRPKKDFSSSNNKAFTMPIKGKITSNFGRRIDPLTRRRKSLHRGIDIAAPRGTPIKATASGRVYKSKYNRWYGNFIIIDHGKKTFSYYCHQSKRRSRKGQRVSQGEVIGYVGSTGKSTGPHLHFEIRIGRNAQNPMKFIAN